MASLHARQRDPLLDQNTAAMLERRGHELIGIGLLVLAVLFTLMLGSYSSQDPGWMVATEEPAQNMLGRFGAAVASTLIIIGGKGAWMIPIILTAWAVRFITHKGAERALGRVVFAVIAVALTSVFFATLVPGAGWKQSFGLGGLFGDTILGTLLGVAPVNAGIGLTLFSILLGGMVAVMGLWVTGFSMPELIGMAQTTSAVAITLYGKAMEVAGRGTAAASGALAERHADWQTSRQQAKQLQALQPRRPAMPAAQPKRQLVQHPQPAQPRQMQEELFPEYGYDDDALFDEADDLTQTWAPEPMVKQPLQIQRRPEAQGHAQPHAQAQPQAQAQAQAQPRASLVQRQAPVAADDLIAPTGEWGRPAALNTTLRADARYPDPLAEGAQYAPPREKLGLLESVTQLIRGTPEPTADYGHELAYADQDLVGYPEYDEDFAGPDEDRIKSRISDAIRARMRHPGPTLNPSAAMPGLRREPPVVAPRSLTQRLRGPQPLLADTPRRPSRMAQPVRSPLRSSADRFAEPPLTAPAGSILPAGAQTTAQVAANLRNQIARDAAASAANLAAAAAAVAAVPAAATVARAAAPVASSFPPAPPLPEAYAEQARLHQPLPANHWQSDSDAENLWTPAQDYDDYADDEAFEAAHSAPRMMAEPVAAPMAAPLVAPARPNPQRRSEPPVTAPAAAPTPRLYADAYTAQEEPVAVVAKDPAPQQSPVPQAPAARAAYDPPPRSPAAYVPEKPAAATTGFDDDYADDFEDDFADSFVENAFAPAPQPVPAARPAVPVMPRAPSPAPMGAGSAPIGAGMGRNVQPQRPNPMANPPRRFEEAMSAAYELPPLALLTSPSTIERHQLSDEALEENARMLESVLDDYGVKGEIVSVRPGPVVTMYELEPAPGLKASRVIGLADDIARSMSALSARVSTVPGRSVIGIELPNATREKVVLREILAARDFGDSNLRLPLALGKDIGGDPIIANLAKMPHLLIAGTTGSGKSVAINTMILSLLYKLTPEECRMIMIDPKMLELSVYDGIPHLLSPVVTDPKKAVVALKWVVSEMEERYRKMSKMGVRNIEGYNGRVREALAKGELFKRTIQTGFNEDTGEPVFETEEFAPVALPYIVIVVDEMADLMMVAGKEIEACIQRLAQMARASGIHLIMATQRPSVDVITGTIKANFPTRISFQVTSKIDSRTILGEQGAEQLLGMGDMLYMGNGQKITRIHGPFVSDEEVEEIVNHLKSFGPPVYMSGVVEGPDDDVASDIDQVLGLNTGGNTDGEDALYDQAVAIVARDRKCSTSYIQRKLGIGYNKAARLVEQMEEEGIVTAANHVGKREILIPEN